MKKTSRPTASTAAGGAPAFPTGNFAELHSYGVEIEAVVVPVDGLNISAAIGYNKTKYANPTAAVLTQQNACRASITAGLAAVISSGLTPIFLLMFSVGLGQERLSWRQVGAIALGVAGVLLLFGPDAVAGTLDVWEVIGASGVVIGCLSYSLGSVLTRPMMRQLAPIQLAALTDVIGGGILLIFSVPLEPGGWAALSFQWGWPAFLAWLYLVIPAALMATTMYFLLVREWGASRPGTYAFISPVIAVVLGSSLFGEKLDWGHGIGMTLMLCGAGLALRRRA